DLAEVCAALEPFAAGQGPAALAAPDQSQLPAHAAVVAWVDVAALPKAADPDGDHWACVVRPRGEPAWVRLPGSGPHRAWTEADDLLPRQVAEWCRQPPGALSTSQDEVRLRRLGEQRLGPLAGHLGATADLPAVRHLLVLPSPALAGVPVEALTDRYTV